MRLHPSPSPHPHSAVVIIAEATKSLEVTPLLMLPIMFAKWVGDLFNECEFLGSWCVP